MEANSPVSSARVPAAIEAHPRPSLAAVLETEAFEAQVLAARYLREASFDEVVSLVTELFDTAPNRMDSHRLATIELAIKRGVELDPARLVAAIRRFSQDPGRIPDYRLSQVYRAWAGLDAKAALEASAGEKESIRRIVIAAAAENDPTAALGTAQSQFPHDRELSERIEMSVLTQMASSDVQAALARADALEDTGARHRALAAVTQIWAAKEPLAALEWLGSRSDIRNPVYFMKSVPFAAKADPDATLTVIKTLPISGSNRHQLERQLVSEWAASDPDAALAYLRSEPDAERRGRLLESYVTRAATKPEDVLGLVAELDITVASNHNEAIAAAMQTALADLAKAESPEKALQSAAETLGVGSPNFEIALAAIARQSAAENPAETAHWIFGLPGSELTRGARQEVLSAWAASSPADAAAFMEECDLLGTTRYPDSVVVLNEAWASRDPTAMLEWASRTPEEHRDRVLISAIRSASEHAPAEAAEYVALLSSIEAQSRAAWQVANAIGNRDPLEAFSWLIDQPAEREVEQPIQNHARSAVLTDPKGASELIAELPQSLRRDHAIAGMVEALISPENAVRDLQAATEWAGTIVDAELQGKAFSAIEALQAREP